VEAQYTEDQQIKFVCW